MNTLYAIIPLLLLQQVVVSSFATVTKRPRRYVLRVQKNVDEGKQPMSDVYASPTAAAADADALGAWVPIGSKSSLLGLGPTRVKVMNINLVVWESGTGNKDQQWSVMRDVCSHKFAALSQGRVNVETSCIECPYHGWQFHSDGKLACVPQMESPTELSPALVEKSSIQSYPVHITGDLIWAFLPTSIHGESFPRHLLPEDYYQNGLPRDIETNANFAVMELPASQDMFLDNAMDPSHFPFAHHGVIGTREDAGPSDMEVIPANFTHVSFRTKYKRKGEFRERIYGVQRPFNFYTIERKEESWTPSIVLFVVPVEEGKVRFISSLGNNKLASLPLPIWVRHILTMKLQEGDTIMHDVELTLRGEGGDKPYITPTSADAGVKAYRKWWKKYGLSTSPPHTFGPASSENLKQMSRSEYTNPWLMHTRTCSHCRSALRKAKLLEKWSLIIGFLTSISANISRHRARAFIIMTIALTLRSIGSKIVTMLEGPRDLSDVPDRSIPL